MVDMLVLGNSLKEHGTKARMLLCVNEDTRLDKVHRLLETFWELVPVKHTKLPARLQGTEQSRLQGVYIKIQTWKILDQYPWKCDRYHHA